MEEGRLVKEEDRAYVRPAGASRLLEKLETAYNSGYQRFLIHGLGGTAKTPLLYGGRHKSLVNAHFI
jgi:hypothetical protein